MPIYQTKAGQMIERFKEEKKAHNRASKPAKDGNSPGPQKGCWGVHKPANTTCLLPSLVRCIPLKVKEFKSSMALSENGIKGWTINLSYSQITGHLRAKILMGSFSPFLLLCNRFMDCPLVASISSYYLFFASAFWQPY